MLPSAVEKRVFITSSSTAFSASSFSRTGASVTAYQTAGTLAEALSNNQFRYLVTNKGPANVPNVQMDDSIPENVDFVSSRKVGRNHGPTMPSNTVT